MSSNTDETDVAKGRRDFISRGVTSLPLAAASAYTFAAASDREPVPAGQLDPRESVNALVFDVFGTVVDWRGSMIREGQLLGKREGIESDWAAFADVIATDFMDLATQLGL